MSAWHGGYLDTSMSCPLVLTKLPKGDFVMILIRLCHRKVCTPTGARNIWEGLAGFDVQSSHMGRQIGKRDAELGLSLLKMMT